MVGEGFSFLGAGNSLALPEPLGMSTQYVEQCDAWGARVTEAEEASAVSLPNTSNRRCCGLTLRYIPTEVHQSTLNSHGKRRKPILVRGTDRYRHWIEE